MMIITIVINMMMELTKEKISWYERRRGFSDDGRPLISGWPPVQYLPISRFLPTTTGKHIIVYKTLG